MLKEKISGLMAEQVAKEFYSACLYLEFANYYAEEGLDGFANWYEVQAREELDHGLMIRRYLIDNSVPVTLGAIEKPEAKFKGFAEPLDAGYAHEKYISASINNIYKAAIEEQDYKSMQFLDWFVREQGEEEKNAEDLIKQMKLFGSNADGLLALDRELKTRTYSKSADSPAV